MSVRRSRTYKLRLSRSGTRLFLDCHCRLAHLLGDLIPHGASLFVGMILAGRADEADLIAELSDPQLIGLAGSQAHFVGASPELAAVAEDLQTRLRRSFLHHASPSMGQLWLVGLRVMAQRGDDELLQAYRCIKS